MHLLFYFFQNPNVIRRFMLQISLSVMCNEIWKQGSSSEGRGGVLFLTLISDFLFSGNNDMFCKNQVAKAPDGNGGVYAGNHYIMML